MSVKRRRVLLGSTGVLWGVWLLSEWVVQNPDISTTTVEAVGALFLRMLSLAATLAVILCYIVSPIMAAVRVGYELGQRAQECDCAEKVRVGEVIQLRPTARRR